MADPVTDEAQDEAEAIVDAAAVAAEMGVVVIIAERLGSIEKGDTETDVATWVIEDEQRINDALTKGKAAINQATSKVFSDMGNGNDEWAEPYYEAHKATRSAEADAALLEGRKAVNAKVGDLCRTSVMGIRDSSGKVKPLYDGYMDVLNHAVNAMRLGDLAYQDAIANAVTMLSRYGLEVVYRSGATRELYAAVRTNVMDGYRVAMSAQRMEHGKAFGADGVEVSAHEPCAPDHLPYQGRRFSDKAFHGIQDSLPRPLVTGGNCRHMVSPVIMGIGKSAWADRVDEMERNSEATVTFTGMSGRELDMTRYEATQYQRKIEREIRRSKGEAYLLKVAGMKSSAAMADARANDLLAYYAAMSKATGLRTKMERTKLYVIN